MPRQCCVDYFYKHTQFLFVFVTTGVQCLDTLGCASSSDHIVAQKANRYIVVFHIAISYDMQRPQYNGRAVGLRAACMV